MTTGSLNEGLDSIIQLQKPIEASLHSCSNLDKEIRTSDTVVARCEHEQSMLRAEAGCFNCAVEHVLSIERAALEMEQYSKLNKAAAALSEAKQQLPQHVAALLQVHKKQQRDALHQVPHEMLAMLINVSATAGGGGSADGTWHAAWVLICHSFNGAWGQHA